MSIRYLVLGFELTISYLTTRPGFLLQNTQAFKMNSTD